LSFSFGGGLAFTQPEVATMFAIQKEYEERMHDALRTYIRSPWFGRFLGPVAFDSPERVVPLQAADLIAHETSEEIRHRQYDPVNSLADLGVRNIFA
jgi:hypothetical protein